MTKTDLIKSVRKQTSLTEAQAKEAVNACFSSIEDSLKRGDSVAIIGFGTFTAKATPEREARNPRTNETMTIPAGKKVSFKAATALKEAVNA